MKALDIYIDAKEQRGFKRRAVARFHKKQEYIEAIFIKRGVAEFHIVEFHKLIITKADEYEVKYDEVQYEALKNEARERGFEFATIHTHINCDSSPSTHDHVESVAEGEVLVGVCEIEKVKGRVRTKIDFWLPQLPCQVNVIRSK